VILEDELREIAKEIVRNGALDKVLIGLDYFDASINRLSAWITGARAMQKALLTALLTPNAALKALQDEGRFTELMVLSEEVKMLPFGIVYKEYLNRVNTKEDYIAEILEYEKSILEERK
jgi:L-rhamnose isomerase